MGIQRHGLKRARYFLISMSNSRDAGEDRAEPNVTKNSQFAAAEHEPCMCWLLKITFAADATVASDIHHESL